MTTDLMYLTLSAGLCMLLWIPYISSTVLKNGMLTAEEYKIPKERDEHLWAQRCKRSHYNMVENLAPFAALVLVAHVTGAANETTALCAAIFFWARVAHAILHTAGINLGRTIAFAISFFAMFGIFWQIIF